MWRHKYLRVLNTITVVCIVVGLMVNVMKFTAFGIFSFMKSSSGPVEEAEGDGQIGRFNSVEAKLSFGTVKVEYGDDYGYYYKNFTTETEPEFKIKNDKLVISQKNNINFNLFKDKAVDGTVTVTIPRDAVIDMDISLNMGSFNLTDINLGNLSVDADMGSITLNNCEMKNIGIQADMGGITFTDCRFNNGDFDANMGGITLTACNFSSASCDADMGSIEVSGTYDSLTADCDMGSIRADNTNKDAKYDMDCDMGNIKINGDNKGNEYKN